MIDCSLFGLNPAGRHVVNLIFHILNTVVLFLILNSSTGALYRSGFVAALFALHPLHVESVAWVAERKDMLSTFFWLLTMVAYFWYTRKPDKKRLLLVCLLFSLGLMSKPMLVTLPLIMIALDFWPLGRISFYSFGNTRTAEGHKSAKQKKKLRNRADRENRNICLSQPLTLRKFPCGLFYTKKHLFPFWLSYRA